MSNMLGALQPQFHLINAGDQALRSQEFQVTPTIPDTITPTVTTTIPDTPDLESPGQSSTQIAPIPIAPIPIAPIPGNREELSHRLIKQLEDYQVPPHLSKAILLWQHDHQRGVACHASLTPTNPEVFATKQHIYLMGRRIGQGAQARVYQVLEFSLGCSFPAVKVAKFSKKSFEREKVAQDQLSPNGKTVNDIFESVSKVEEKELFMGICSLGSSDLRNFSLDRYKDPILTIVNISKNIAAGLASIHRSGQIHRDLKPENIILFSEGNEVSAKVTDWGLVTEEKKIEHLTVLTPKFAPDFIWENLVDQKNRKGVQTKQADAFSAGRTFLNGCVLKLFSHYQKRVGVDLEAQLSSVKPTTAPLPKTDEELLNISGSWGGPIIIDFKGPSPSNILFFPSHQTLTEILNESISKLQPYLKPKETLLLQEYINLVLNLQQSDPAFLPNMEEVERSLEEMRSRYLAPPPALPRALFSFETSGKHPRSSEENNDGKGEKRRKVQS